MKRLISSLLVGSSLLAALAGLCFGQIVTVTSPANNSQFLSPAHYVASASSPQCARGITGMRIYLAPHVVAYKAQSNSIDTELPLTPGSYKTVVQAWDACGNIAKTVADFTVTPKSLKPVRFAYVADGQSRTLIGFKADPNTNARRCCTPQGDSLHS